MDIINLIIGVWTISSNEINLLRGIRLNPEDSTNMYNIFAPFRNNIATTFLYKQFSLIK